MGFGTLFIGYALLVNITYFGYTDLISALILLLGLYKLSSVNKHFKSAAVMSLLFSIVGAIELFVYVYKIFVPAFSDSTFLLYVTPARYVAIGILSAFTMLGIMSVAEELSITKLNKKSKNLIPVCYVIFISSAIIDLPFLRYYLPTSALTVIASVLIISMFAVVLMNLFTIYSAYMQICMPSDLKENRSTEQNGIFDRIHEHQVQRGREYAEYKLNKTKNRKRRK